MSNSDAVRKLAPDEPESLAPLEIGQKGLALMMSGGGARAAYQMGVLRGIVRRFPEFAPSILTGVSAGAINAAYLANHTGHFPESVSGLGRLWRGIRTEHIINVTGP
ncbi:MAG: patatin-like phospholipase family protein, partial [Rubricoccaceae bacterium]|nr:patatin-like phospholipase family protein [Rubricoccaceae bacterium]